MLRRFGLIFALTAPLVAQVAAPAPGGVVPLLPSLSRTVEDARVNLARLRIEKWKTNGENKQDAQARAQSLQRNMSEALPALVTAAQQNPQSSNAAFKLYRNVNVLYDVMSNLTESAGAFGAKEEYAALARDLGEFDQERRALGNALEAITAQKDAEVARIQQASRQAQSESAPPKKIIIDDEAPAKKVKPKTKKKAPPAG
ncbi:MAG: hypothetical protein ACRD3E_20220 [Terriglobales bacterium]